MRRATALLCVAFAAGVAVAADGEADATVDMVRVPAGAFVLGHADGESWEGPPAKCNLPLFFIDRREVSNADYARFVAQTGHRVPDSDDEFASRDVWKGGRPPAGSEQRPVVLVARDDAEAYCAWRGAHLPTTWEWEKAARGPMGAAWPWGSEPDAARANLADRGKIDGHRRSAPVDGMPRDLSPYDVEQMAGNVAEWVAGDFAEELSLALDKRGRPKSPELLVREAGMGERRGGHWNQLDLYARGATRWRAPADERSPLAGFRCAASSSERHR